MPPAPTLPLKLTYRRHGNPAGSPEAIFHGPPVIRTAFHLRSPRSGTSPIHLEMLRMQHWIWIWIFDTSVALSDPSGRAGQRLVGTFRRLPL